jgi:hypothetical protein
VREWFGDRLKQTDEPAWKAAHGRLYEHLRDTTKEGETPMLADLAPLYQAIAHGCCAGHHQKVLDEIYIGRICRKEEYFAINKLGALSSDLAAISWFFEKPYEMPVASLDAATRRWVLSGAGAYLRSQGRVAEAIPALRKELLQLVEEAKRWSEAAVNASNLSEAEQLAGEVTAAVMTAEKSVVYADRGSEAAHMIIRRTTLANALHAAGRRDEAESLFIDAEGRQKKEAGGYPLLYSQRGYFYCDLLLAKGDYAAACIRAAQTLEWFEESYPLHSRAFDLLTLGRGHLGLALAQVDRSETTDREDNDARNAKSKLDSAIEAAHAAGTLDDVPLGHLARAKLRRAVGDWDGAARDLDEVEEIAEQGPMKLFLCDMALERARLAFAKIEAFAPLNRLADNGPPKPVESDAATIALLKEEADKQLAIAADYIKTCGYHRREKELAELKVVLRGKRKFAKLAPRV